MELRQLRYFVAVAEERSFTRAASRLHLSQQSLSAAVARFEAQLGCRLLERSSQHVQPTPAGRALLARAPAVFAAVDAAVLAMRDAVDGVRGEVRIRFGAASEALAEPLLNGFADRHPHVAVHARPGMDSDNLAALRRRETDAVLRWATAPAGVASRVVAHEQALIAMPDRHRLAPLATIPVDELAEQPLVMFAREGAPDVWDVLVDGLGARRATITQVPVGAQSNLAERVLRGEGLCPVSATLSAQVNRPGLVLRPLHPPLLVPLLLAWQEPATVALQALIDDVDTVPRASDHPVGPATR